MSSGAAGRRQRGGIISHLLSLLFLLALLAGIYIFRVPLLRAAGNFWVVDDGAASADAIIILGDDNIPADRASRAAELYRAHWAPRVVASGRFLRPYASIAELERRDLTERGVPAGAVVLFAHHAGNTREEALALRSLAVDHGWRHVLVVTSNFHTRRTRFIFRRVWPAGSEFRVISARDVSFDPDSWWHSRVGIKLVFMETVAICVAAWELSGHRA